MSNLLRICGRVYRHRETGHYVGSISGDLQNARVFRRQTSGRWYETRPEEYAVENVCIQVVVT